MILDWKTKWSNQKQNNWKKIVGRRKRKTRKKKKEKEDYYKPVRVGSFWSKFLLNMKAMEIEIKHYQLKII